MTAAELMTNLSQGIYVLIFVLVLVRFVRRPTSAHANVALFFGALAVVILASRLSQLLGATSRVLTVVEVAIFFAIPYFLLRLVDDFTTVPRVVKRVTALGLGLAVVPFIVFVEVPPVMTFAVVLWFVAVLLYCSFVFVRASRRAAGVTMRRMEAISLGSVFLGVDLVMVVAGNVLLAPEERTLVTGTGQVLVLASATAYYLGFAPPEILRRAWQEPALRAFMGDASRLARLATMLEVVRALERGAAQTIGTSARVILWAPEASALQFWDDGDRPTDLAPGSLAARCYAEQRTIFTTDPARDFPDGRDRYARLGVGAVLLAPITTGGERLGVLVFYAERPPIFADSDIETARVLAAQCAAAIQSRSLFAQATAVRAREDANKLKEDFLSAAAHDLRTPLTTVVAQAEFMARKAQRNPAAAPDPAAIGRIVREGKRLAGLVTELLDAARLEDGGIAMRREAVDLGAVAKDVVARIDRGDHPIDVSAERVVGHYDRRRMEQLVENLVENALKYSAGPTPVSVKVWAEDGEARLDVSDQGIGIPESDLPRLFQRFTRGSNVDDRRFHGMGLGLYICRGIVEEHAGRIWADSVFGRGSTFHVALPLDSERRS